MSRVIALCGAFDRFNFGDLLFPEVVRHFAPSELRENGRWQHFALIDADLTDRGGQKVASIRKLIHRAKPLPRGSLLIVPGGEVLSATAAGLYGCLFHDLETPRSASRGQRFRHRLLLPRDPDQRAMDRLGIPWRYPLAPHPAAIPGTPRTAFLGVGGRALATHPLPTQAAVADAVKAAAFCSVRDPTTQDTLTSLGAMDVGLAPDSVHAIRRMLAPAELLERAGTAARRIIHTESPTGYFCFQAADRHVAGAAEAVAREIDRLAETTGWTPVLVSAGTALGHDDHLGLRRVSVRMSSPHVVVSIPGVMDVVALLAHARLVVATSLHANIIAISYAVPRVPLSDLEPKTAEYLRAWDPASIEADAGHPVLAEAARKALARDTSALESVADHLADRAVQSIASLWNSLTDDR